MELSDQTFNNNKLMNIKMPKQNLGANFKKKITKLVVAPLPHDD